MQFQVFDLMVAGLAQVALIVIGLSSFAIIDGRLKSQLSKPPTSQLLLIFAIYGALFLMILHLLTWPYSGMAFLGFLATIIVAPFVGLYVSYSLRQLREESKSHMTLFVLGILYTPIAATLFAVMFFVYKWSWKIRFRNKRLNRMSSGDIKRSALYRISPEPTSHLQHSKFPTTFTSLNSSTVLRHRFLFSLAGAISTYVYRLTVSWLP